MGASVVAISPHLDDAVFGCAELLAAHPRAAVITVFAGVPDESQPLTDWDAGCGFSSSREAMLARREEDREALSLLGAVPCWLDFHDAQYGKPAPVHAISAALGAELQRHRAHMVALPLGLFHSDHKLASRAALALIDEARTWIAYEDALYRRISGAVEERLGELRAMGIKVAPFEAPRAAPVKRRAMHCYASQLRGLSTPGRPGHADLDSPERYWRLLA